MRKYLPDGQLNVMVCDKHGTCIFVDANDMIQMLETLGFAVQDLFDVRHEPTEFSLTWRNLRHFAKMLWRKPERAKRLRFRIIKQEELHDESNG